MTFETFHKSYLDFKNLKNLSASPNITLFNYRARNFGERSQISTDQKLENTVFGLLIGSNLGPFPKNFVLRNFYNSLTIIR